MFGTVGAGAQPGVLDPPGAEAGHDGCHEALPDVLIPEVRTHGQRPKESHTPPAGGEVRADQRAIEFRTEGCRGIGVPAGMGVVDICPKLLGLGYPAGGPKGETDDAARFSEVLGAQRADDECHDATPSACRVPGGAGPGLSAPAPPLRKADAVYRRTSPP